MTFDQLVHRVQSHALQMQASDGGAIDHYEAALQLDLSEDEAEYIEEELEQQS